MIDYCFLLFQKISYAKLRFAFQKVCKIVVCYLAKRKSDGKPKIGRAMPLPTCLSPFAFRLSPRAEVFRAPSRPAGLFVSRVSAGNAFEFDLILGLGTFHIKFT